MLEEELNKVDLGLPWTVTNMDLTNKGGTSWMVVLACLTRWTIIIIRTGKAMSTTGPTIKVRIATSKMKEGRTKWWIIETIRWALIRTCLSLRLLPWWTTSHLSLQVWCHLLSLKMFWISLKWLRTLLPLRPILSTLTSTTPSCTFKRSSKCSCLLSSKTPNLDRKKK